MVEELGGRNNDNFRVLLWELIRIVVWFIMFIWFLIVCIEGFICVKCIGRGKLFDLMLLGEDNVYDLGVFFVFLKMYLGVLNIEEGWLYIVCKLFLRWVISFFLLLICLMFF